MATLRVCKQHDRERRGRGFQGEAATTGGSTAESLWHRWCVISMAMVRGRRCSPISQGGKLRLGKMEVCPEAHLNVVHSPVRHFAVVGHPRGSRPSSPVTTLTK